MAILLTQTKAFFVNNNSVYPKRLPQNVFFLLDLSKNEANLLSSPDFDIKTGVKLANLFKKMAFISKYSASFLTSFLCFPYLGIRGEICLKLNQINSRLIKRLFDMDKDRFEKKLMIDTE